MHTLRKQLRLLKASLILSLAMTTAAAHAQQTSDLKWYDKITVGGDFRYRHEMVNKDDDTNEGTEHLQRMRARLNMTAKINDSVKTVLQLASGEGKANTTNQTYTGGYTKKGIYIDMAYAQWSANSSTEVLLGKVKNTLYVPGDSDLFWDADLTPEGATVNWTHKGESSIGGFVNLGNYWYDERDAESTTAGAAHSDVHQYSAQAGVKWTNDDRALTVGVGQHTFAPTENQPILITGKGNTKTAGNDYVNDYEILEVFLAYNMNVADKPFVIFGNLANNGGADEEESGYLAGFIIGKLKNEGDWSLGYNYRKVEADAVLDATADSDFANGETDNSGHRIQVKYQLATAVATSLTYLTAKRAESSATPRDYERAQLDFNFTF